MRRLATWPMRRVRVAMAPGVLGGTGDGSASTRCRLGAWPSRVRGFSLIEALVALVILSVGLLGVGQLMLVGLQTGSSALLRTQAVYLLGDMMERIRANPDARDAYDCATYAPAPTERGCAPSGVPARQCTARELAEDDLARWQEQVRQALPIRSAGRCEANVRYVADAGEPDVARYEVEVTWQERGQDAPASLTGVLLITSDAPA
jgi:type IV pilus assembly protein PilV